MLGTKPDEDPEPVSLAAAPVPPRNLCSQGGACEWTEVAGDFSVPHHRTVSACGSPSAAGQRGQPPEVTRPHLLRRKGLHPSAS